MPKQPPYNNTEAKDLSSILQNWALDALSKVRSAHGKWIFHGGTALGQAYGSTRFSEDLDFMVDPSLETIPLMNKVLETLKPQVLLTFGPESSVTLKTRVGEKNPSCFHIVLSSPKSMSNIKVKVEFWETKSLSTYAKVSKLTKGHAALVRGTTLRADPAVVEVADLSQIFVDKWFALMQRAELKHRDVWDLAWLLEKTEITQMNDQDLYVRLIELTKNYPNYIKGDEWLKITKTRLDILSSDEYAKSFKQEMLRWLPETTAFLPDKWFEDALDSVAARLESILLVMNTNIMMENSNDFRN